MTDEILVKREDKDGVATITLNRPEKRNAVNHALFKQFYRHIEAIEKDGKDVGIIVLRGAGGNFCAGHDINDVGKGSDRLAWLRREILTLERLTKLRQPVIAAVQGACMTGGLEMAVTADLIVAGESAQFADTHGKWGLVPGWGLSQRLPRRVGQPKALEMMLTCRTYSGREAEAMGLANVCVPDDQIDATVDKLCKDILANSWHSNGANKALIYETDGLSLREGIAYEIFRNEGFDPKLRSAGEQFKKSREQK
jgi:enoyl-CoA hydratase/carnithine racemase